jgi:hypothetical protein
MWWRLARAGCYGRAMKRIRTTAWPWLHLATQSAKLAIEAQQVIALRLAKLAAGGPRAAHEASTMVSEKLAALARAQSMMVRAAGSGRAGQGAKSVMAMYLRKVRANRRRLGKG